MEGRKDEEEVVVVWRGRGEEEVVMCVEGRRDEEVYVEGREG